MKLDSFRPNHTAGRIALLVVLVALALGVRTWILPVNGRVVYSTFYPAIALVAMLSGYRYGVLSILLSALLAYVFLIPSLGTFKMLTADNALGLITFICSGLVICLSFTKLTYRAENWLARPTSLAGKLFFALLIIGFALSLRMTLLPVESRVIYSTFYPAIAVITLVCGAGVGMLSIGIAAVLCYFMLLSPFSEFKLLNLEQVVGLLTFFVASTIICLALREVLIRGQKIKQANDALQDLMSANSIGKTLEDLVQVIASTVEMRDPYTAGHQRRVSELAVAIAREMALPDRTLMGIKLAGLFTTSARCAFPSSC